VKLREGEVQEELEEMGKKVREAMKRAEGEREGERRKGGGWWDGDCREKKRRGRRALREWRKRGKEKEEYKKEKKEYNELCGAKKREENKRWEKEAEEAKTEEQVWRIVNRERRKWKSVNEGIGMNEWEKYFREVLGGVDGKVVWGEREGRRSEEEGEVEKEEIRRVLGKLKDGKAMGVDGVPNEVWKYGGEEIEGWVWRFCNRVWRGEGWPEEWKEGVVVPILKKGKGDKVKDYRGVTIMPTIYKIYAAVLAERLREDIEGKGMIPPNQTGFRRGMGTMDNVYVLNYIINRQIGKKGGKMVAVFVDLKAAFDSVVRERLMEALRNRGVRKRLRERIGEIMRETKGRVRVGEKLGEAFWMARGVRQGCPLSPLLFNLLIADLEEEMGKVRWGGVRLGERKLYSLAYADDIVLVAEDEGGMRSMLERLEAYLDGKGLELNRDKTKVMRFRRGGGRMGRISWRWKGGVLEEVREYKYLGYTLQRNGGQEAHIRDRVAKAAAILGQVWGIGKRRFGKDWKRRVWMFDTLIWTVLSYGVEIWGWKEREEMERLQERYVKWVLGVERRTPGYLVREEVQREKLKNRARRRVWNFEERLVGGGGSEITRWCLGEVRERMRRGRELGGWEEERREFWGEQRDIGGREEGQGWDWGSRYKEIEERDKEEEKEERWERIRNSRYNEWYQWVKGEGVPRYLGN